MKLWQWGTLAASVFLLYTCSARADGMKFPPASVELYPHIPSQRALISFRDGVETLTIESSYDGEGDTFGWIIPVPATPTRIEEGSSTALSFLSRAVQPHIEQHWRTIMPVLTPVWVGFFWWCFLFRLPKTRREQLAWLVGGALIAITLMTVWAPLFRGQHAEVAHDGGPALLDVDVEMTAMAGDLEVQALRAGNPEDLNAWLAANGFKKLPEAGEGIVRDYIDEGWRFCAAKERRGLEQGVSRTHALRVTFPAEQPVYPMRLTALAGNELSLKLFVVGDARYAASQLDTQCARSFEEQRVKWKPVHLPAGNDGQLKAMSSGWYDPLVYPKAVREMWDGCMVTHLTAALAPADMKDDIVLHADGAREYVKTFYTKPAAEARGINAGLRTLPFALLATLLLLYDPRHTERRRLIEALAAAPLAVALAVAIGYVTLQRSPIAGKVVYRDEPYALQSSYPPGRRPEDLLKALSEGREFPNWYRWFPENPASMDVEVATRRVLDKCKLVEGDEPGQYEIRHEPDGLWVRMYGDGGFPNDIHMGHAIPDRYPH